MGSTCLTHEALRERVEDLAQAAHDLRRSLDDFDLLTGGDLPGLLAAAANTLDWAVDCCESPLGSPEDDVDDPEQLAERLREVL